MREARIQALTAARRRGGAGDRRHAGAGRRGRGDAADPRRGDAADGRRGDAADPRRDGAADGRRGRGARELGAIVAAAIAVAVAAGCGGKRESAVGAPGGAIGAAIAAGLDAAAEVRAPWRCAALDGSPSPPATVTAGAARWTITDRTATLAARAGAAGRPLRIAFVADAEAPTDATRAALAALRAKLTALGVDAVVALGGMGGSKADLVGTLGALTGHDTLVVAVPGDREPALAHREAVAALAGDGVIDGAAVRWIVLGEVGVATLPGQPFAARLAHGVEGCGHADADAAAVLAIGPTELRARILATQRAPRHADTADRGALGAAAGDAGLAAAIAGKDVRPDLVVHASLDGAAAPPGRLTVTAAPRPVVMVATGVASSSPRLDAVGRRLHPAALVVTIESDGNRLSWQPITR
jgi:hypothetical protein